ncbi:hypothetical protein J5Y03_18555 [Bacillus sp. RG28]|uniref:Uncharacterized protein n=1 Tax=Gottfriedia endophytica TaxID=2820819 RepID=A0A940NRW1_9BACI|nr:hypothetical protein [Gottfriedia endophytica]MBP0727154.1 hypothetical protein [Gottfriedia endophytica]
MIRFNYFTYALMNTITFLPYFLFIIIGNSYHTILNGWFPLIIFYTFKYTGPFLINSFQTKIKARELLLTFIAIATVGAFCGVLAPLSPMWIELAAVLMGTATGILLPLYTTIQFHEKSFYGRKMKGAHFLFALLTALIIVPLVLFTAHSHYSNLAFLICGIALSICFISLRQMPQYEIAVNPIYNFRVKSFIIFIIFTALIFIIKATRKTDLQIFIVLLLIGSLTVLAILTLMMKKFKVRFHLPKYIHFFAFIQGMTANFFLLYGTFYALSQKSNHFVTYGIYLPYGLGIIFSLFLGGKIVKKFNRIHPLSVISVGSFCGLLLTLIPWTIPIGGFFIGFFSSLQTRTLNRLAYAASESYKDSSLLLRNRWSKLGRMINQTILALLILLSSYLSHIPFNQVFLIVTGKSSQYKDLMFTNLLITGFIIVVSIGILFSYGNWRMKDKTGY